MKLFKAQPNKVIFTIVVVDFFVNSATGLIGPFFAIFVTNQIVGGSATVIGISVAIFWLTKSFIQIPISRWLDRTDGERDEFWAFFLGYMLLAFTPLLYFFSTHVWHIYIAEMFHGLVLAFAIPAWFSIFTRHVDKTHMSFGWSLRSTVSVGFAATIAAVLGGVVVDALGFKIIFLIASSVIFISSLGLFRIRSSLLPVPRKRARAVFREYTR